MRGGGEMILRKISVVENDCGVFSNDDFSMLVINEINESNYLDWLCDYCGYTAGGCLAGVRI